jgi:hypothetical protein
MVAFAVAVVAAPLSLVSPASGPFAGPSLTATPVDDGGIIEKSIDGRPTVDAPLSNLPVEGLPPVDRVAGPGSHALASGPINGTPFSSTPTGTLSEGGTQIAQSDRTLAPADADGVVPNLGR